MLRTREIVTTVGTLGCAIGIGFIMQGGVSAKERYGATKDAPVLAAQADVVEAQASDAPALLEVQQIMLTSAQTENPKIALPEEDVVLLASAVTSTLETPMPEAASPLAVCDVVANGKAVKAAMIELTLDAPCFPNERVTVHHRGMMFTQITAKDGTLTTTVPALDENALVIFAFASGDGAVTQLQVPELRQYNRTAIQSKGNAGFELHAREFGADYGDAGHVWKNASRDPAAINSAKGFLTRLGNPDVAEGLVAQVYTFPKEKSARSGIIDLSVEAEVTAMNCGQEIEAQSLEVKEDGVKSLDLILEVPSCDTKGSFLVLNNLVEDLKVASN